MNVILDAKYTGWSEPVNLDPPALPPEFYAEYRLELLPATVVQTVGSEVMLFINDPTDQAYELAALEPLQLQVTMGVLQTESGVVGYVVFSVPNPGTNTEPFAAWERYLDPHNPQALALFEALATQSHWHVVVTGPGPEVLQVVEFANVYEVAAGLEHIRNCAQDIPTVDFGAAIGAVQQQYGLLELYHSGFSRHPMLATDADPMDVFLEAIHECVVAGNKEETRRLGAKLHESGGMESMFLAHKAYTHKYGDAGMPRVLETFWNGIGQWQS